MKILVALSRTRIPENILALAHKHAQAFKGELYIMISMKQGADLKKEDLDKAESKLEKIRTTFKADGIPCEVFTSVCFENPWEDLVKFATDNDVDEIIVGVRKKSKVGKMMFGSTAQYVILKAPCPVVAVK